MMVLALRNRKEQDGQHGPTQNETLGRPGLSPCRLEDEQKTGECQRRARSEVERQIGEVVPPRLAQPDRSLAGSRIRNWAGLPMFRISVNVDLVYAPHVVASPQVEDIGLAQV